MNWCKYKRWCCCPFVPSFVYPYKKLIANCFHRWPFPFFVCLSVYLQIELNILPQNILFPIKGLDFVLHGKWAHVKRIEVNGDRDSYYISCVYKYINILSNEAKQKERLTHIQEITVHLIYIYIKFYLYFAFMRDNKLEDKIVKGRERERESAKWKQSNNGEMWMQKVCWQLSVKLSKSSHNFVNLGPHTDTQTK